MHAFLEPLCLKYYGLDTTVLGFQLFVEIHFLHGLMGWCDGILSPLRSYITVWHKAEGRQPRIKAHSTALHVTRRLKAMHHSKSRPLTFVIPG